LEIEDDTFEYEEQTDPGAYNPDITGDEEEYELEVKKAEHKQKQIDYQKYLGVRAHLINELVDKIEDTWLAALKRPRTGFANVTVHQIFEHLTRNVAKPTTKQKMQMKKEIYFEWDQTKDITEYFTALEQLQIKLDRWDIEVSMSDLVEAAVNQMQDSGLFDHKFLRDWERKPDHEKTWENMQDYYKDEYDAIKTYGGKTMGSYEQMNNVQEDSGGREITDFFDEFRRDAMVGHEQIQQMAGTFQKASDALRETTARLKEAHATIQKLTTSNATLVETNAKLTATNQQLTKKLANHGGKGAENKEEEQVEKKKFKCKLCNDWHPRPAGQYCKELERNKHLREAGWKSKLG
jgi:methyl-accepting chemotaxis protein